MFVIILLSVQMLIVDTKISLVIFFYNFMIFLFMCVVLFIIITEMDISMLARMFEQDRGSKYDWCSLLSTWLAWQFSL